MQEHLNTWLNVALLLVAAGAIAYFSCLGSTTWFDDE